LNRPFLWAASAFLPFFIPKQASSPGHCRGLLNYLSALRRRAAELNASFVVDGSGLGYPRSLNHRTTE
jgi:hypothetical protein